MKNLTLLSTLPLAIALAGCGDSSETATDDEAMMTDNASDTAAMPAGSSDEMSDDAMSNDAMAGDSSNGDDMTGDDMTGDDMTGDNMAGDRPARTATPTRTPPVLPPASPTPGDMMMESGRMEGNRMEGGVPPPINRSNSATAPREKPTPGGEAMVPEPE